MFHVANLRYDSKQFREELQSLYSSQSQGQVVIVVLSTYSMTHVVTIINAIDMQRITRLESFVTASGSLVFSLHDSRHNSDSSLVCYHRLVGCPADFVAS